MIASPLPDRDRRHLLQFYIAPRMDYAMRLFWTGLLFLAGFGLQLFSPVESTWVLLIVTLPLLLAGTLLLLARGYNLRPLHLSRGGTWEKTTRDRFARLRKLEDRVKNWDESLTDVTCVSGVVTLFLLSIFIAVVWVLLERSASTRPLAPVFVADAVVLLIPHWITGTRRGWRPVALRQQLDALEVALATIEKYTSPSCQIQPMFEMAGKEAGQTPVNARAFIRFPDGPTALLGLQFQVALNNVQGTSYPYLYAVIVAEKGFGLVEDFFPAIRQQSQTHKPSWNGWLASLQNLAKLKEGALTVESSREKDVEVIVIRQKTSKTSGYHTQPAMIRHIAQFAWQSVEQILARTSAQAHAGTK